MGTKSLLPNLRLSFACKERWEDMVGDERVRACAGCHRDVFNLSAMTRDEAERLLATRGLTPCVRFYRRPDGTVMTTDCPTGERRERRRLAVVATSLAAGATLASSAASAAPDDPTPDSTDEDSANEPDKLTPEVVEHGKNYDDEILQGIPARDDEYDYEMGDIAVDDDDAPPRRRAAVQWSFWGRIGQGFQTQRPTNVARSVTPPESESESSPTWEAALAAELTLGITHGGNLRVGAWAELRTSSGPVAGSELVIQGLPPHPMGSRINGAGSLVLRAGGNEHVFTTALGFGYVGSFSRRDPWIPWANHLVGARIVASVNRSLDDPRDWSATFGLEVEPLGVLQAVLDFAEH